MKLNDSVRLVENDGGAFLLDSRKGVYWHLNAPGQRFVTGLTNGQSLDAVVRAITDEYEVDEQTVRADCLALFKELQRARLVTGELS